MSWHGVQTPPYRLVLAQRPPCAPHPAGDTASPPARAARRARGAALTWAGGTGTAGAPCGGAAGSARLRSGRAAAAVGARTAAGTRPACSRALPWQRGMEPLPAKVAKIIRGRGWTPPPPCPAASAARGAAAWGTGLGGGGRPQPGARGCPAPAAALGGSLGSWVRIPRVLVLPLPGPSSLLHSLGHSSSLPPLPPRAPPPPWAPSPLWALGRGCREGVQAAPQLLQQQTPQNAFGDAASAASLPNVPAGNRLAGEAEAVLPTREVGLGKGATGTAPH